MVEKVPDSTYENVGGLDKQIKEIKEVIELPVKHPELFDALGIAQPKVCSVIFSICVISPVSSFQCPPNINLLLVWLYECLLLHSVVFEFLLLCFTA